MTWRNCYSSLKAGTDCKHVIQSPNLYWPPCRCHLQCHQHTHHPTQCDKGDLVEWFMHITWCHIYTWHRRFGFLKSMTWIAVLLWSQHVRFSATGPVTEQGLTSEWIVANNWLTHYDRRQQATCTYKPIADMVKLLARWHLILEFQGAQELLVVG